MSNNEIPLSPEIKESLEQCHLDHIAIAVSDIEQSAKFYSALGVHMDSKREVVEDQKVKTAFGTIDINSHIELLESTDESGPIAKFIKKNGPGLHHVCFRVQNVEAKMKELKAKNIKLIYEGPRKGANNCLVNFIHPKSSGGVLIEISQKLEEKR